MGCFFMLLMVSAQMKHPKASPLTHMRQEIGLTSVTVEYSRPGARGRKIFGELVPYGRIWRVGANASTKITFDSDVSILGNSLPKGTYALYAFPQVDIWEIVFHTNTTHWGDGRKNYNPEEDALRVSLPPQESNAFQENFLISFDNLTHNSLVMVWRWETTEIRIPIELDTHAIMQGQIEKELRENPTAQTYYEAARYYQEQRIKYETALEYLNKAIDLGGDTYYFHRVKSLVQAAMGTYQMAIQSAQKSRELAALEGKDEFVRMNERNIAKWQQLLKAKQK